MLDTSPAFAPLFAGALAIASVLSLAGCVGSVASDGPSLGPATGSAGTSLPGGGAPGTGPAAGTGSGTGADGGGPPATPGVLSSPYTRLTRAEYQATIKAAYGVDAPVTGIPDDGRVGPFTSNVFPSISPIDPVQVYMLASEDLADAIVPAKLPACTAANAATCVAASYQAPIERLYRRALSPAELTALANIVISVEGAGLSSQDATRAMVLSTLISPSFLFRSTPLDDPGARGRGLAELLGFALWDAPPDAELVAAGKVAATDLGASLKEQAARLGADARAVPVLARFLAQWLAVDLDARLADPNASLATSPLYAELQAFVKTALTTNMSVKSFANGTQGFIQKSNFAAYAMPATTATTDVVPVTWGASTVRRGILAEELFMDATRHPNPGRRPIFRGHMIRSNFLCQPVAAPPANVVCLDTEVKDRTTDPRCMGCHSMMDPIGKAFAPLDLDNTAGSPAPVVNGTGEVSGTFADLPAMFDKIADSQAYADCFSRNLLSFFLEQNPDTVDSAAVSDVSAVVKSGGSLADAVGQAVVSLEKRSQSATAWCSAQ